MFSKSFKKGEKNVTYSVIVLLILMFPLVGTLTQSIMVHVHFSYGQIPSTEVSSSSNVTTLKIFPNSMTEKNRTEISQENDSISAQLNIGDNDNQSSKSQVNKSIIISKITHAGNMVSSGNTLAQSPSKVSADFNGDGFGDKAIGVAGEDIGIARDTGAVNVIYGSPSGLSAVALLPDQFWTQNSTGIEGVAEKNELFGWTLSSGDYNGDGKDDLAIAVPFEGIGPMGNVGAVNIIYGSAKGLSASEVLQAQLWSQDSTGVEDDAEGDDYFGYSLSSADYNGDGKDDLAIGVAGEDIGVLNNVGAVNVIYGSAKGLSAHPLLTNTAIPSQFWSQQSTGVEGDAETGDWFGYALSSGDFNGDGKSDIAIGVPLEDTSAGGLAAYSGAVNIIYGSTGGLSTSAVPPQFWTQNSTGMAGVAEGDDYFGYSLSTGNYNGDNTSNNEIDDLVVGAVGEDIDINGDGIDDLANAGAVNVIYGSMGGLSTSAVLPAQLWTQNSTGIEGVAEVDDVFGLILSSGDYNGDGKSDLAIGVPSEDINGAGLGTNAGAVNVIYGSLDGLSTDAVTPSQFWTQNSTSIQGIAEPEDNFGFSLSSGDYNGDGRDDLAIGVPQEDIDLAVATLENFDNVNSGFIAADTGVVQVIYGSNLSGLSASGILPDQVLRQGFANIEDQSEDSDFFGYSS